MTGPITMKSATAVDALAALIAERSVGHDQASVTTSVAGAAGWPRRPVPTTL